MGCNDESVLIDTFLPYSMIGVNMNTLVDRNQFDIIIYEGREYTITDLHGNLVCVVEDNEDIYIDELGTHRPNKSDKHTLVGTWTSPSLLGIKIDQLPKLNKRLKDMQEKLRLQEEQIKAQEPVQLSLFDLIN